MAALHRLLRGGRDAINRICCESNCQRRHNTWSCKTHPHETRRARLPSQATSMANVTCSMKSFRPSANNVRWVDLALVAWDAVAFFDSAGVLLPLQSAVVSVVSSRA